MKFENPYYKIDAEINWEKIENELDWFKEMKQVPQDIIWHGEGNVQVHTKMVVKKLLQLAEFKNLTEQDKHILFTTALLHDVEKRSTSSVEIIDGQERIVSPRHALKGEYTARTYLYKKLNVPFKVREHICKLVRYHGLPIWAIQKSDPRKKVIEASLLLDTELLAIFSKADMLGRICDDAEEQLYKIALFKELCQEHNCFGKARKFSSNLGRYKFLSGEEVAPDYDPYDDTKFEVIMMSALPGSGKDTYIKNNIDLPVLSLDNIRRENKIEPTDKKANGKVIQLGKEQAKVFMRKKQSFVFNATNLTKDRRSKWISLFTDYKAKVKIIYIEVPYKQLMKQNHNRTYKVPEKVIENMIAKLEIPNYSEAHDIEYVVNK